MSDPTAVSGRYAPTSKQHMPLVARRRAHAFAAKRPLAA